MTLLTKNRRPLRSWPLLALLCLLAPGLYLARADAPVTSSNRFLFIIDVSAGMKSLVEPLGETIFDLIYSGIRGRMSNGDSYGVWLAGGGNDTSVGVATWKSKFAVELASRTALRVKERGTKGAPALTTALTDAGNVAKTVGDVTVIIVSNGDTPLHGTPFDEQINAAIAEIRPAMRLAKATVNVALVAQDGRFIAWAVNSPDFLIDVPVVSPKPPIAKTEPLAKISTPPLTSASAAPPQSAPATSPTQASTAPTVPLASIFITRDTVDREKQATRALAAMAQSPAETAVALATPAPPIVVAPPAQTITPVSQTVIARSNSDVVLPPTQASNAALKKQILELPGGNAASLTATLATPVPQPSVKRSEIGSPEFGMRSAGISTNSSTLATTQAALPAEARARGYMLAGITIGALLGASLLLIIRWARGRRNEGSIVSRALALQRLSPPRH